ncbi:MAG TPA: type II toxin-antitoxin system VapC family toxin [Pyrinomonadaceae bacterium]|nr:type II toxin-antitoxin system VapC family toxin [Pyrinomonadaceae bacterium]
MSGFLLDTNVISELIKPRPEANVTTWIERIDESLLYLSVLTLGEIRRGIAVLPQSRRRATLEAWLDKELRMRFEDRILAIDQEVADRWGLLTAAARSNGIVLPVIDGLLAATALEHNLTLVTRDTGQIPSMGVAVFNPWENNSMP